MRARLISVLTCCALLAAIALVAQEIPSDELFWGSRTYSPEIVGASAIRVQSDLVEVATVVRDSHEKPVGSLKKEDFLLFDNGKPQTISAFSVQLGAQDFAVPSPASVSNATEQTVAAMEPRYVALFFDDMNTSRPNINFARTAATKFIRKGLDPLERIGIFTASGAVTLDFTEDAEKLLAAIAKLALQQRMSPDAMTACPHLSTYQAWVIVHVGGNTDEMRDARLAAGHCGCSGGSAESCARSAAESVTSISEDYSLDTLDAIKSVIHHLGQMSGRRVLLLASSGFLTLSFHQQQQKIIEAAVRANVVINSLDTAGLPIGDDKYKTHWNLSLPMSDLALGTGGQFFHNNNDLTTGLRTLSAPPSVTYVLGFSPTSLRVDGTEHKLKVKLVTQEHLSVSARPSYYAPSPEPTPSEKRFRKLEQSVMASEDRAEIPVEFSAMPEKLANGESSLRILVHVDVRKLAFQDLGDRHSERLIFITALFDEKNQFLTGVQGVMDLRLKATTLKQVAAQGLSAKLSIQAPVGSYRVRQVVQEAVDGKLAVVNRMVEVR